MQVRIFLDRDKRQGGEKKKKRRWNKNKNSIKVGTTGSECVAFAFRGAGLSALQKQFLQSMSPRVRLPTLCFASAKDTCAFSSCWSPAGMSFSCLALPLGRGPTNPLPTLPPDCLLTDQD